MKTSEFGVAAIMQREGLRLVAYKDTVGVWTIGVGHTGRTSPPAVSPKMRITKDKALAFLAADLAPVEAAVNAVVKKSKVRITQTMYDAMVSLAFNIGIHGFIGSTVAHRLSLGDRLGAADAFLMWKKPKELLARRRSERKQFLS